MEQRTSAVSRVRRDGICTNVRRSQPPARHAGTAVACELEYGVISPMSFSLSTRTIL
jgi:hypothetical protein